MSKKLQTQQPVYWSVTPSAYLSKVRKVVECYEREILVKKHVFTFLSQLARDAQSETFHKEAMTEQLESQMKVQLVVWMLEPEIDAERYVCASEHVYIHRSTRPASLIFVFRVTYAYAMRECCGLVIVS